VKRKDFNTTLKQLTDGLERMCSGNRFHSDGAATANERAPNFVAVLGMTRSSHAADRSLRGNEKCHQYQHSKACLVLMNLQDGVIEKKSHVAYCTVHVIWKLSLQPTRCIISNIALPTSDGTN